MSVISRAACFLGVDLGAESGRVMAGWWNGKAVRLEEIHRFPNGGIDLAGSLRWDLLRLWEEVRAGIGSAAQRFGNDIVSIGVATWAIDFVLLSRSGEMLGQPYHYRDSRTRGLIEAACACMPRAEIFASTGLQFMELNTLYQLMATQRDHPELLESATSFLLIPDFFHWCLTARRAVEFTNATTTQFLNPLTRTWAVDLLRRLDLPHHFLPELIEPGTTLGPLRRAIAEPLGLTHVQVNAPATHDTASAVAAVPAHHGNGGAWAYISSGTWSLVGVETSAPLLTARVCELNFTNEGGIDRTWRLLKNVMGLWIMQCCRRIFQSAGGPGDTAELVHRASKAQPLVSLIDPDDRRFLNPPDMVAAIQGYCRESSQPVPIEPGAIIRCVLESLALKYRFVLSSAAELVGEKLRVIHIVGGGCRNQLLNQFTADATDREVVAGPAEATALGNVLMQLRSTGELRSLAEMREVSRRSSELTHFAPTDRAAWDEAAARFPRICLASGATRGA